MTESKKVKSYYLHTQELMDATDNGAASVVLFSDYDLERTARLEAERKLEEIVSYLPKVPTQPYEKEMAMKIKVLEARLEKCKKQRDGMILDCVKSKKMNPYNEIEIYEQIKYQADLELDETTEESIK